MFYRCNIILLMLSVTPLVDATGTIVPLYVYPSTDSTWKPLENAVQAEPVLAWAIINPSNGPGNSVDGQYLKAIDSLVDNANILTMGYVRTNYKTRHIDEVKRDIDSWKAHYPAVTGIFVDEMPNTYSPDVFDYYVKLRQHIIGLGYEFSVGNPGTAVNDARLLIFDSTVIYENAGFPLDDDLIKYTSFPGHQEDIPIEKFAVMAYNVSSFDDDLVGQAQSRIGYIFIQNVFAAHPWNSLPTQDFMVTQFKQYAEETD